MGELHLLDPGSSSQGEMVIRPGIVEIWKVISFSCTCSSHHLPPWGDFHREALIRAKLLRAPL